SGTLSGNYGDPAVVLAMSAYGYLGVDDFVGTGALTFKAYDNALGVYTTADYTDMFTVGDPWDINVSLGGILKWLGVKIKIDFKGQREYTDPWGNKRLKNAGTTIKWDITNPDGSTCHFEIKDPGTGSCSPSGGGGIVTPEPSLALLWFTGLLGVGVL